MRFWIATIIMAPAYWTYWILHKCWHLVRLATDRF